MTDLVTKTATALTDDVDDPSVDEGLINDSFDLDHLDDSIMNDNASLSGVPDEEVEPVVDDIDIDIEPVIDDISFDDNEPSLVDDIIMESTIEELEEELEEEPIPIEEEPEAKNTPVYSKSSKEILSTSMTEPKKKTSSKKKKKTPPKKKGGSDPLHRLYATQTSATKHQNYKRAKEYEKSKVKETPIWGVDEKALRKANQLKSSYQQNRPSRAIEYSIERASAKQRNAIEKKKLKAKAQTLDIWGVDDKALRKASGLKTKYGNIPPSEYLMQTTNATHHQQWLVYKELERSRRKEIKIWGVDERNMFYDDYDQQSAPVYNSNKYNYRSTGNMSVNMSITSNMSERKRRPDSLPGYFSSSHSYSDYYYSGARRKRASSAKPFTDRTPPPVPRNITPKIGSAGKHTNYLKKYGTTNNHSTKSRSTRTTMTSSSSAVHANIRDVIIKDMDAQSVLTHDDNQSWIGENSYDDDDETNDHQQEEVEEKKKEKETAKTAKEEKLVPNSPENVIAAKEKLKKVASPIKKERKQPTTEPASSSPSPKKKKEKKARQQDGPSMAPKRASDPHFATLQDKLQADERKVLEETKELTKMQRLKKQTLTLFDKDKKKHSIRNILAKAPKKTRLKRGKSLQFWKKRKDLDDNESKKKITSIREGENENEESEED